MITKRFTHTNKQIPRRTFYSILIVPLGQCFPKIKYPNSGHLWDRAKVSIL